MTTKSGTTDSTSVHTGNPAELSVVEIKHEQLTGMVPTDVNSIQDDDYSSADEDEELWERRVLVLQRAKKISRTVFKSQHISRHDIRILAECVQFVKVSVTADVDMTHWYGN